MKKINFIKRLLLVLMILMTCCLQMWATTKRIYFDKSRWNGDNATFWARAYKSADNTKFFDYKFVNTYAGDIMFLDVDTQYDMIVFVRNNSSATAISWSGDAFWGKTGDLRIADGNRYILSDYKDAYSNGNWDNMMPIGGGTIYLDNSLLGWVPAGTQAESKDNIQFFHGDDPYTYTFVEQDLQNIDNTLLWYKTLSTGNSACSYMRFANAQYGSGNFGSSNEPTVCTSTYCDPTYSFNSGDLYIFTTNADGTTIAPNYQDGGYTAMNKTITLAAKIKAVGSASYVAGTSKGQLGASSYTFSDKETCTTSSGNASVVAVGGTSGTFSAGYTANTTLTVSSVDGNYTFKGWYDADDNLLSEDASYTGYRPKSTTTVYAYFEEKSYNVTAVASPAAGGTVTPSSATAFGRATGGNITATYNEGYYFTGWTGGAGSYGDASEANTTFTPSADNQTVTANFDYTWCVKGKFPEEEEFAVEHLLGNVGKASGDDTCHIEMSLPANTSIDFKIVARDHDTWWSCSSHETKTEFTYTSHAAQTCYQDNDNKDMTLTTAGAGTYKFAWNITDRVLTIYYPTSYKVTYDANDGTGTVPTDDDYYASGATVTAKGNTGSLSKSGYNTLAYWNTEEDCSGTDIAISTGTFDITANTTLYAKWTQSITLNANGGSEGSTRLAATYNANLSTGGLANPHKIGYAFAGWATAASEGTVVIQPNGTVNEVSGWTEDGKWIHAGASTLYATWTADNNEFTGTDGDWTKSTNWSAGKVPTDDWSAVTISKPVTITDAYVHIGSLEIEEGGSLTIAEDGALEVAGTISNSVASRLVINSTGLSQGALIFNSTGSTTANVNMTMNASEGKFQFIAIPVSLVSVNPTFAGTGKYTYVWSNSEHTWERRGYYDDIYSFEAVLLKGQGTAEFNGNLVSTGNITYSGSYSSTGYNNVYMYGNSWTAPIKLSEEMYDNVSIGIMNGSANSWDGVVAGEVIPALQAFAVAVHDGGGSITINYDRDVRNPSTPNVPLKAPKHQMSETQEPITVYVSGNEMQTRIRLFEDATRFSDEFDNGWEALYMEGYGYAGEMYAVGPKTKMNVLATSNLEGTVVGFVPGQATDYTISFTGDGKGYYLNDIATGESTLIDEANTYNFKSDENTNATRFVVSKMPLMPTGVDEVADGSKARKQMIDGTLYIIRDGRIYKVDGALVK